jgi:hypothetical protein
LILLRAFDAENSHFSIACCAIAITVPVPLKSRAASGREVIAVDEKSESISDLTLTKSAETIISTPRQKLGGQALRGGLSRGPVNLN